MINMSNVCRYCAGSRLVARGPVQSLHTDAPWRRWRCADCAGEMDIPERTVNPWRRLKLWYCERRHRATDHRFDYCECGQSWPCNTRQNLLNGGRW